MQHSLLQVRMTGATQVAKDGQKTQACAASDTGARIAPFFISFSKVVAKQAHTPALTGTEPTHYGDRFVVRINLSPDAGYDKKEWGG